MAEKIFHLNPQGVSIVGKTETENIGIEKLIKNTITNPNIKVLLLCGIESNGHCSGQSLISLIENGVDETMRIIGSPGKKPILNNTTLEEAEIFRKQVRIFDMIGTEDVETIGTKIKKIYQDLKSSCDCKCGSCQTATPIKIASVEVVKAQGKDPQRVKLDKAGYFVIIPQPANGLIVVEHYSYKNQFLRVIEGQDARSIYWTIIENGWVTELSHAAYLGKELTKAEISMKFDYKYVQDGA